MELPNEILNLIFIDTDNLIIQLINKYWMYQYHIFNNISLFIFDKLQITKLRNIECKFDPDIIKSKINYFECVTIPRCHCIHRAIDFINLRELKLLTHINNINNIDKLVNLETLIIPLYTGVIGDVFNKLTNLQVLNLSSVTQPLKYSLFHLTKLQILNLSSMQHKLESSLISLTKLEDLFLDSYIDEWKSSLYKLGNLKFLQIGSCAHPFNGALDYSLHIMRLIILYKSNIRYHNIINDITILKNLEILTLPGQYILPIPINIKEIFPKLKIIYYMVKRDGHMLARPYITMINDNIKYISPYVKCEKII